MIPDSELQRATEAIADLMGADCKRCQGTGTARYMLNDDTGTYTATCGECEGTGHSDVPRIYAKAAASVLRPDNRVLVGHCKDCRWQVEEAVAGDLCGNLDAPTYFQNVPPTYGCVHFQEREP